ncbi:MAG: tryptophan 2,3-dioxygenase [Rhizobacter sp.]|nr:tryptophan 2,3-dioxygenase [Chlorobiales bacterium]
MPKSHAPVYYADYLRLEQLLSAQLPKSTEHGAPAHDEMLFIIVHQAYELWFKQILFELGSVAADFKSDYIDERSIGTAVARLGRITEIQKVLIDQLRILETMTPQGFLEFRDFLSPASGFQSVQFRLIENLLGLSAAARLQYNHTSYHSRVTAEHQEILRASELQPSLFDLVEKWLERTPFLEFESFNFWRSYEAAVKAMLQQDRQTIETNPTLSEEIKLRELQTLAKTEESFSVLFNETQHDAIVAAGAWRLSYKATKAALLIHLYRDEPVLHLPFKFLTLLVDIDELFTTWRQRHALMTHRMIGTKIGTGGSSGHQYLRAAADTHKIFSDFFNLATFLIPRTALPLLPPDIRRRLGFFYTAQAAEHGSASGANPNHV